MSGGSQAWQGGQTHVGGGGGGVVSCGVVIGGVVDGAVVDGGVESVQRVFTRRPNGAAVTDPS